MKRGPLKIVLDGRGAMTLRESDYIAAGGEAAAYRANSTAIKIYHDSDKMRRDGMADKVRLLANELHHTSIVAPLGVVLSENSEPIGFYMPFVDGEPMARAFTTDFRLRTGFGDKDAIAVVDDMRGVFVHAHSKKALAVDPNELNWLIDHNGSGYAPKVIDVDSWAIGRWKASVIMPSIRDWNANDFSEMTDWFAFGVVSFQLFTGIHPYKGRVDGFGPGELVPRMKSGISVFDKRARLNHAVRDFSCIPGPLLAWYEATFQSGNRSIPPSPHDVSKPARAAAVVRAITTASGALIFEKIFDRPGDGVVRVWSCGAARLASGKIVDLATGRDIGVITSPKGEVVKAIGGWLLADWAGQVQSITYSDGKFITQVPFGLSMDRYFAAGNRLFGVTDREMVELNLRVLGRPMLTVGRRWSARPNATAWLSGIAVQDVLGAAFVIVPTDEGISQIKAKELDGMTVVSARAAGRFASIVVIDRAGDYHKVELTFDKTLTGYSAWIGPADSPDMNMAILPTGVVATIVNDGELALFVPTNGNVNKIADRQMTTAVRLASWDDRLLYVHDGAVWRIRMK